MMCQIASKYLNSPAIQEDIDFAQESLQIKIRPDIVDVWKLSNGLFNDDGIYFFDTEIIKERNETNEVFEYTSDLMMIGNDSGGYGFFMKKNDFNDTTVYTIDVGAIGSIEPTVVAKNLEIWINNNFSE